MIQYRQIAEFQIMDNMHSIFQSMSLYIILHLFSIIGTFPYGYQMNVVQLFDSLYRQ